MNLDVATERSRTAGTALALIRVAAFVVGIAAIVGGGAYLTIAAIGPDVWWPSGGSSAGGAFVAFPLPLRLLNAGAVLFWCLTVAGMALVVAALTHRLRHGVLFVPAVSRAAWALAIVLAVGSATAQILENIGRTSGLIIGSDIDPQNPVGAAIGWGVSSQSFLPNLPLLGVSVVLGLLAFIISAGERLQRDTEGLV